MVEKPKVKMNTKKILEKLIVDVSSNKKTDKKEEDKKQVNGENKKEEKIEKKQLEEVVVVANEEGVNLEKLGLVQTDQTARRVNLADNLEKSVRDVSTESIGGKNQEQAYSAAVNKYNQEESPREKEKRRVQQNRPVDIPLEHMHSLEGSSINRGPTPLKNVGMIHNPELQGESRAGYEPYHVTKIDTTSQRPWESQESKIKKYKSN
jgi:hypothetical protein